MVNTIVHPLRVLPKKGVGALAFIPSRKMRSDSALPVL